MKRVEFEREAVDKAKKELQKELENLEKSETEVNFCSEKLAAAKEAELLKYKSRISSHISINRQELMELKSTAIVSPDTLLGYKVFTTLLSYEYKSGETLIECSRRLLADPKLLGMLNLFDPSSVSENSIERMKQLTQNFDRSSSKSMMYILAWFDAILNFHKEMDIHKPLRSMLAILQSLKESAIPVVEQKKVHLNSMETAFASLKADFDRQMKRNEDSAALLREAEKVFILSQSMRQSILNYKERLKDALAKAEKEKSLFFYNSMISAALMAFLPSLPQAERLAYLNQWYYILESYRISSQNPSQFSFSHFVSGLSASDILVGCDLMPDPFLMDNIYIAKQHYNYPAFYDPYGIAIRWIVGLDRDTRVEIVGSLDDDISHKINVASLKGTRIIVRLVEGIVTDFLEDFIVNSQSPSFRVEHDGSLKPLDSNFKLYIVISGHLASLNQYQWLKKCTLIYCSLDHKTANALISDHIFGSIYKDKKEEIKKNDSEAASLRIRYDSATYRSAEFVIMVKKEDLSRGDLYRNIIENDEMISSIEEKIALYNEHEQKKAEMTSLIKKLSWPMAEIFMSLDKLTLLNNQYSTSFAWFLDLCTMIGRQLISFEGPHLRSLISQMLLAVYNYIKYGLTKAELTVWGLELAIISGKYTLETPMKNVEEYLEFLGGKSFCSPSVEESALATANVHHDWIPMESLKNWERLGRWQKFKPIVESITRSMGKFSKKADNNWDYFFNSENPLNLTHLSEFSNLSAIDKLVIVYVLRPDCINIAIENLLNAVLSSCPNDMPPDPVSYMFRYSNISTFIWIINEGSDDLVTTIKRVGSEKSMANSISVLSLKDENFADELKDILLDAIRRGRWIVISDCECNSSKMFYLGYIIFYLLNSLSERNQGFRLWLISKPFDNMPISISQHTIKIRISNIRSLRSYMHELLSFSVDNNVTGNIKTQVAFRKILFSFLTAVSFLKNSGRFQIAGLNSPIALTEDEIIRGLKLSKSSLIDFADQKELLEKFQQLISKYVLTTQSFDIWDQRIICSSFARFISVSISDIRCYNLPSFRNIYEAYAKSDIKKCFELIKMLPSDDKISPLVYGLDENAQYLNSMALSTEILDCFQYYHSSILEGPFKTIYPAQKGLTELCEYFLSSIKSQCTGCFDWSFLGNTSKKHFEVSSKRLHLYSSKSSKYLEHVLRNNIERYRELIILVVNSLDLLISILNGSLPLFSHFERTVSEIKANQVPSVWILSRKCYLTCLKLDEFIADFASRLKFINHWYYVRQNPSLVNKGCLIIYEITKMFCPKGFLEGLLLDYSTTSKESIESLDLDITILGAKPSSLPEKGAYICGLSLVGASWDFSKGILKSCKLREHSLSIPCVSLFSLTTSYGSSLL